MIGFHGQSLSSVGRKITNELAAAVIDTFAERKREREREKYDLLKNHHQSRSSGRIVHFSGRTHVFIGKRCGLENCLKKLRT